ncbi:hypothetical protein [Paenibacillus cymbidii]|uniref:hypothetical protein n=1 Tax=Paenibacillus cymbidii TaxID=1639034 RepID=UPI00143689D2|nr:hypothetical protein [Paenibacillus cymbidii]
MAYLAGERAEEARFERSGREQATAAQQVVFPLLTGSCASLGETGEANGTRFKRPLIV